MSIEGGRQPSEAEVIKPGRLTAENWKRMDQAVMSAWSNYQEVLTSQKGENAKKG